jgi:hypothetical protein
MVQLATGDPSGQLRRNARMADFYYETRVGSDFSQTDEPVAHVDEPAAIADALRCLADMAKDELPKGYRDMSVTVRNARQTVIYEAKLTLQVWP